MPNKLEKTNPIAENRKLILLQFIDFLEKIPERHKEIIIDRYGLIDNKFKTFRELSNKYNISYQRIYSIEKNLFDKIYYSML
jgi:DNA-directed RNA polymerase sigma subunit (sigma70/sigma32)